MMCLSSSISGCASIDSYKCLFLRFTWLLRPVPVGYVKESSKMSYYLVQQFLDVFFGGLE